MVGPHPTTRIKYASRLFPCWQERVPRAPRGRGERQGSGHKRYAAKKCSGLLPCAGLRHEAMFDCCACTNKPEGAQPMPIRMPLEECLTSSARVVCHWMVSNPPAPIGYKRRRRWLACSASRQTTYSGSEIRQRRWAPPHQRQSVAWVPAVSPRRLKFHCPPGCWCLSRVARPGDVHGGELTRLAFSSHVAPRTWRSSRVWTWWPVLGLVFCGRWRATGCRARQG